MYWMQFEFDEDEVTAVAKDSQESLLQELRAYHDAPDRKTELDLDHLDSLLKSIES